MAEKNNVNLDNKEFEKERSAGSHLDQLSYICDYCGKVNPIGATKCTRCGKRRPRNEYVNAMAKINSSKTIKQEYVEEQAKVANQQRNVQQQQLIRLVESRVEEEKQFIKAQEAVRIDQEADFIKKTTARDAVLRIVANEKATDDRIRDAEQRADNAIKLRDQKIDNIIDQERNKILEVAAQKIVASRAGVEEAAREQIETNKQIANKFINDTLESERDKAERNAARKAVLQIIAAEKAAEDKIREEREDFRRQLQSKQAGMPTTNPSYPNNGGGGAIQPFTIVPYVNPHQPLYQTRPNQVFKFVPRDVTKANGMVVCPANYQQPPKPQQDNKNLRKNKKSK
ncbi:MAG: hypothetical protein WCR54_04380 [Clostridia bacterium]